jgi:hypothetical protein
MACCVPCRWCGFMETSHKIQNTHWHRTKNGVIPCEQYTPLDPWLMEEIESAARIKDWTDVLPHLGTNYCFTRRALEH